MRRRFLSVLLAIFLGLSACAPAARLPLPDEISVDISDEVSVDTPAYERLATGAKQGAYYEVFVRSFADSDGDGIGDFRGLTDRLGYIADLGVTGIWLMPCFPSPSYHGYDVSDYYAINPDYGTMTDFEAFLSEADQLGLSVILDLVVNHTSTENAWFQASRDPESPYRGWYRWADDDADIDLSASFFGNKIWNKTAAGYYTGLFWSGMPDLNYDNPEVRAEIKKIAKFWLDKGVAGFRLDAAMYVYTAAEMGQDGRAPSALNLDWWTEFGDFCRSVNPNCYLVGEVWDNPTTRDPYTAALDSVFHFDMGETLARAIVLGSNKGNAFVNSMKTEYDRLTDVNPSAIDAIFLSNHDQTRISTALGNKLENMKMAASVYLTLQGLPFLYYGEELGMMGGKPDENIRTPFLWGEDDAALCTWMDSVYNKKVPREPAQEADPNSLLSHYRKLLTLRTAIPALFAGKMEPVAQGEDAIIAYTMTAPGQTVLVLHNLSSETKTTDLDGTGRVLFVTDPAGFLADGQSVTLPPKCSAVIEK